MRPASVVTLARLRHAGTACALARRASMALGPTLALAWLASGCGGRSRALGAGDDAAPTASVDVRRVETRIFPEAVRAPGQWRSADELVVAAPFAALVESLAPRIGDRIERGSTIGWLETRESLAAVHGAESLLRQAADSTARAEAKLALTLARRDLLRVPLVATATGTVLRRAAEPGAEVAEGTELLAIVPDGAVVFEAHVPLAAADRVAIGQPAHIVMEGGAATTATVQRRLPNASSPDQSALVWLSPGPQAPRDLLDRFGTAAIQIGPPRRSPAVSDSALVEDDLTGEYRVARVDSSGVAIWTVVQLGLAADGWHELLGPPLPPGTRVIVDGQRGLPDSIRVRVRP